MSGRWGQAGRCPLAAFDGTLIDCGQALSHWITVDGSTPLLLHAGQVYHRKFDCRVSIY